LAKGPTTRLGAIGLFGLVAVLLLIGLVWFNSQSAWIGQNGGLASWVQAVGSLLAIAALALAVLFERQLAEQRARQSVLASAQMANELMATVARRAFDENAVFSEWWVPQWHVIDEVMASCPIHDIHSKEALQAFVTIRELYGRMRAWDEKSNKGWPNEDASMQSYVGSLCLNAARELEILKTEFSKKARHAG
jgi:hypothetical protein